MFRDPSFYREFRERVVPLLRTYPFIRIWHAGCSTGEEVFSMAILLEEEGLYQSMGRLSARAVSHGDPLVTQGGLPSPRPLDPREHLLFFRARNVRAPSPEREDRLPRGSHEPPAPPSPPGA